MNSRAPSCPAPRSVSRAVPGMVPGDRPGAFGTPVRGVPVASLVPLMSLVPSRRLRVPVRRLLVLALLVAAAVLSTSLVLVPPAAHADETHPQGAWPLDPRPEVEATFDPPDDPWGAGHRGVDLAGRIGQAVRSALPGEVRFAGRIAGKPVVTVSHGDTRTTYEPVVGTVPVGTRVSAGDVIGTLDLPGSHCFPRACLHWGWLRGDTYLDPLDLVGGGPVRLLPLWRDEPVATGGWRPPVHPYADWVPPLPAAPPPSRPATAPPPPGGRPADSLP